MFNKNSKVVSIIFCLFMALSFGIVNANEENKITIDVDEFTDNDGLTVLKIKLNGEDTEIKNLQLMESEIHKVITESGKEIEISLAGGDYQIKVDGENINTMLSDLPDKLDHFDIDVDVDIGDIGAKVKEFILKGDFDEDKVLVIGNLTVEEKDALANALKSLSSEKEFEFIGNDLSCLHHSGNHKVKILKIHK